jgi:hypothetical protein
VLAIDHHRTRTRTNQLKITIRVFDEFNGLFVNIPLGTFADGENESVLDFADLHPVFYSVSASLIQSTMTELLRP